jgi:hypothetical protein
MDSSAAVRLFHLKSYLKRHLIQVSQPDWSWEEICLGRKVAADSYVEAKTLKEMLLAGVPPDLDQASGAGLGALLLRNRLRNRLAASDACANEQ